MACGVPAVFYIAPDAADIAAAEPDEIGGSACMEALTLQGVKMLHYRIRISMLSRFYQS
jgi:hypothetical protein